MTDAPYDPCERCIEKDDLSSATAHLEQARARSADFPQSQAYSRAKSTMSNEPGNQSRSFTRATAPFTVKYDGARTTRSGPACWRSRGAYGTSAASSDASEQTPPRRGSHARDFQNATGGPAWSDGLYEPSLGASKSDPRSLD